MTVLVLNRFIDATVKINALLIYQTLCIDTSIITRQFRFLYFYSKEDSETVKLNNNSVKVDWGLAFVYFFTFWL